MRCVLPLPPGCSVPRGVPCAAGQLRGDRGDGRPVLRAGVLPRGCSLCVLARVAPVAPFCFVSRSLSCS